MCTHRALGAAVRGEERDGFTAAAKSVRNGAQADTPRCIAGPWLPSASTRGQQRNATGVSIRLRLRCLLYQPHACWGHRKTRRSAGDAEHPAVGRVLDEGEAGAAAPLRPTLVDRDEPAVPVVLLVLPPPRLGACLSVPCVGARRWIDLPQPMPSGHTERVLEAQHRTASSSHTLFLRRHLVAGGASFHHARCRRLIRIKRRPERAPANGRGQHGTAGCLCHRADGSGAAIAGGGRLPTRTRPSDPAAFRPRSREKAADALGRTRSGALAHRMATRRGRASAVFGSVSVSTPSSSCAPIRSWSTLSDSANERVQCPTLYSV
jgi:hypothetical protein